MLERSGFRLVRLVAGEGHTITEAALALYGENTRRKRDYCADRFRECLAELAVEWGYRDPNPARPRKSHVKRDISEAEGQKVENAAIYVHGRRR